MNDFDQLLGELNTLSKAAAMDSKVMAAAKEGGAAMPDQSKPAMTEEEEEAERERQMMKGEDDGDGVMGKSFAVTLPDGTTQEAYDGTQMLKAMGAQVSALAADRDAARADLNKALSASTALVGLVKQQGEMMKAMSARVEAMANTGRGRQATVSLADKPGLIAGSATATSGKDVMAKAMTAFRAGTLDGSDVSRAESHLGRGLPVPADILDRLA